MNTKKNEKMFTPKKQKRKIKVNNNDFYHKKKINIKIKSNDINNNNNSNYKINPNININKIYLRNSSKNKAINKKLESTNYKIRKAKALSNNNVIANFNKSRQDNNIFDINNRFSCHIQNKVINNNNYNNSKLKKHLTIRRTFKKHLKEINLPNADITGNYKKLSKNKTNTLISINNLPKKENTKEKIEILRRTNIPHNKKKIYENLNLYNDINEKEKNDENEIKNKVIRHNTSLFIFENNIFFSDEKAKNKKTKKKSKIPICQLNTGEHELDKFFRYNSNIINPNNELIRFSNISDINKNEDVYYLNKNMTEIRNNNIKIETIEGNESQELLDFEEKILEEINDNENNLEKKEENKNEQIITVPCLICNKLINIDEADAHSNKCFNTKNNNNIINKNNSDNNLIIINNKLKNIFEYLEKIQKNDINIFDNINSDFKTNSDYIKELKLNINKILNINDINKSSLDDLSKINTKINTLMEKCLNSQNIFTLFSRTKILLEEKSKFFSDKIKKNGGGTNSSKKNAAENTFEEILSESETAEFFDLKKMEKILDEKELKTENLEKLINETKNKRLFLMEVLKVKFQKINENKNEDLIQPEMIWKEAVKKNIEMQNWAQFIFNELNNPNKYLKMLQKKNNKTQKKK